MRTAVAMTVVLLIIASVLLTITVPALYLIASQSTRRAHASIADLCALRLEQIPSGRDAALAERIDDLERRYGLLAIKLEARDGKADTPSRSDRAEVRSTPHGTIEIWFPDEALKRSLIILRVAAVAGIAASLASLVLLLMNAGTALRSPADRWARSESSSAPSAPDAVFETFRTSIRTLKGRETELQRLHDEQRERAEELAALTATLVRSLASGFIATDDRGLIVDMNGAARDLLGVSTTPNPAGRSVIDVFGSSAFGKTLAAAVDSQKALQREEVADHSGVIGLSTVPLRDETGRYFGMLALFTDLTPMRKLEGRVREMQSLADLGEMAAGIAHEFRNSLSTILGYLRLVRLTTMTAEGEARLGNAEKEARLLTEAVESLLNFARPVSLKMREVDLSALVGDLIEQFRPALGATTIAMSGDPLVVVGDLTLLRRAFENLLRNAIEAVAIRGSEAEVRIRTASSPHGSIVIEDNGVGLNPDDVPRLFLPFQSTKPSGFGLGLALARKIILVHGGSLSLTGRPGAGATVTAEFPSATAQLSLSAVELV
jgi:signal transduction histidine kinase